MTPLESVRTALIGCENHIIVSSSNRAQWLSKHTARQKAGAGISLGENTTLFGVIGV